MPDLRTLFDLRRQPGYYNPSAKVALLRRARHGPRDELLVDFRGSDAVIRLTVAGEMLASGPWTWQTTVGGMPLLPTGSWTESCWHRDAACDYLELEVELSAGWRVERQMLLARRDRFLLIADAVIGPRTDKVGLRGAAPGASARGGVPGAENAVCPAANGSPQRAISGIAGSEIRHTFSLPKSDGTFWIGAAEAREGWLTADGKRRARMIPLALPEWRAEFSHAELASEASTLTLRQAALGRNLYAPLWIDLEPGRARRPLTWRRLTVAENLEIVPRDVAVAYRVQVGRQQWLLYRSLDARGNRTFLGQNYSSEFVCCRFLENGEADEIVAIE